MKTFVRCLMLALLVGVVAASMVETAVTQGRVTQVASLNREWGNFKVEDIIPCEDGTAWGAGVGSGSLDDLLLFKITGFSTSTPKVDTKSLVNLFDEDFFGTGLPAGIGPRGYPGIAIDLTCSFAYIPSFFLHSVIKVDLVKGVQVKDVKKGDGVILWPANYGVGTKGTIQAPVDAQLNYPAETRVIVSSSAGELVVLNALTGAELARIKTGGTGPGSVLVAGDAWAMAAQNSQDIACVDLKTNSVAATIPGLGTNPFLAVASRDGSRVYVSNTGSNSVSVLSGAGCARSVSSITVGNAPRHMALSSDNRFLYVSNSTDNSVSVIDTRSTKVVETIAVAPNEPAPVGVVAISPNNRYLYVYWEGGIRGTPGLFQIRVYDVSGLYQ